MEKVTDMCLEAMETSNFVQPRRLKYKQDGVSKVWDLLLARKTVASVIYNKTTNSLVMVKQFRPVSKQTHFRTYIKSDNLNSTPLLHRPLHPACTTRNIPHAQSVMLAIWAVKLKLT